MLSYFRGLRARRAAEALCKQVHPDELIQGSWICASETNRFIVRVFYGQREQTATMLPPWRECFIVAVNKTTLYAAPVGDETPYRPILR